MSSFEHFWRAVDKLEPAVLMHVGLDGTILYVNSGVGKLLGYAPPELIGKSMTLFMPDMVRASHERMFSEPNSRSDESPSTDVGDGSGFGRVPRTTGMSWHERLRCTVSHKNGRTIPVELTVSETWTACGRLRGYLAFMLDSSEMQGMKEKLRRQATYDSQTGLLCMKGFQAAIVSRFDQQLDGDGFSLINLDIDHFSALSFISSKLADNAIRAFAAWLQVRLNRRVGGESVLVCKHFNASEFVIYLPGGDGKQAMALARNIRSDFLRINLATDSQPFHTTLSMGVATITDSAGLERGLSRAANACYIARARGGDRIVGARERDLKVYRMGQLIRDALREGWIDIYAQKIVNLRSRSDDSGSSPLHFEILCRLRDKSGCLQVTEEVFRTAEITGLALPLDLHMIKSTLDLIGECLGKSGHFGQCSINLSGMSLSNQNSLQEIRKLVRDSGISATSLCFEITESAAIGDCDVALQNLQGLRDLGCKIAIDDFGSGYSNHQSLSQWPVDIVKIDGFYIRGMFKDPSLFVDTVGMIASARARGMKVIAEYAETRAIVDELIGMGVDFAQGFMFHRPEPLKTMLLDHLSTDSGAGESLSRPR